VAAGAHAPPTGGPLFKTGINMPEPDSSEQLAERPPRMPLLRLWGRTVGAFWKMLTLRFRGRTAATLTLAAGGDSNRGRRYARAVRGLGAWYLLWSVLIPLAVAAVIVALAWAAEMSLKNKVWLMIAVAGFAAPLAFFVVSLLGMYIAMSLTGRRSKTLHALMSVDAANPDMRKPDPKDAGEEES